MGMRIRRFLGWVGRTIRRILFRARILQGRRIVLRGMVDGKIRGREGGLDVVVRLGGLSERQVMDLLDLLAVARSAQVAVHSAGQAVDLSVHLETGHSAVVRHGRVVDPV